MPDTPISPAAPSDSPADHDLPEVEQFIAKAQELRLTTVVVAWKEEYGQVLDAPGVVYERLAQFSLLAYHRPTSAILRCHQQGDTVARKALAERLRTLGFTVEERTRNEMKYRT
jgi:hypothetical protein